MDIVQVPGWERYRWLRHGFSTRAGGVSEVYGRKSLNLGWTEQDDPVRVAENRRRLMRAIAGPSLIEDEQQAITLRQVHSTVIHTIRQDGGPFEAEDGRALLEGDGLITSVPGVFLGIQTADCVPVIVIDPKRHVVAVFHAGWRGTVATIVQFGIAKMTDEFNSHPSDLIAAVGPSIGPCCYSVGEEVRTALDGRFSYANLLFENDRLNLWEANRRQLLDCGVPEQQIVGVGECTGCALDASEERKYFSHRMDHGITGRMMTVVGIAKIG